MKPPTNRAATWPTLRFTYGAGEKSRTPDLRITNALLYQLSYAGVAAADEAGARAANSSGATRGADLVPTADAGETARDRRDRNTMRDGAPCDSCDPHREPSIRRGDHDMSTLTDEVDRFAPSGILRAAINLGNPILAGTDPGTGSPRGVSV